MGVRGEGGENPFTEYKNIKSSHCLLYLTALSVNYTSVKLEEIQPFIISHSSVAGLGGSSGGLTWGLLMSSLLGGSRAGASEWSPSACFFSPCFQLSIEEALCRVARYWDSTLPDAGA